MNISSRAQHTCTHSSPYFLCFKTETLVSLKNIPKPVKGAIIHTDTHVLEQKKRPAHFRAEKRNEHAWTFYPRSPGRVWKNGGISNNLLPKNKMFPLITWKEKAICLQKLQAVVITLSLVNFLEEYLIVKRTLTTLISLRCTGNVHA